MTKSEPKDRVLLLLEELAASDSVARGVREALQADDRDTIDFAEAGRENLVRTLRIRLDHARDIGLEVLGGAQVIGRLRAEGAETVWLAAAADERFQYTLCVDIERSRVIACMGVSKE